MAKVDYKINSDRLILDLYDVINYIVKNKKQFSTRHFMDFMILNSLTLKTTGFCVDDICTECLFPNGFLKYEKLMKKSKGEIARYIYDNKEILYELYNNLYNILNELDIIDFPYYDAIRKYSQKDMEDIILSFYSQYPRYYNIIKKYFDEDRIGIDNEIYDDYLGYYTSSTSTKSGYIILKELELNSFLASVLAHELGHAIDRETFLFLQQKDLETIKDFLREVPSTCFETLFTNYLINQKIDTTGGLLIYNEKICNLDSSTRTLRTICSVPEFILKDGTILLKIDNNEKYVDVNELLAYNIASIISLYLNLLETKDRDDFLKRLNNLITGRKEYSLEQVINELGISIDDFVNLKYVKEDIKDKNMQLKKRFKYYS